MYYPALEEFRQLKQQGNLIPVCREIVADLETPVSAFLKVRNGGYSFLLESVEGGEHVARYSFIGTDPYNVIMTTEGIGNDPLQLVEQEFARYSPVAVDGLPDFYGGVVGYLGYETVRRFERLPSVESDPIHLPESVFMLVDTLLAFDHVTHKIKIISHAHIDGDPDSAYKAAVQKIEALVEKLQRPIDYQEHVVSSNSVAGQGKVDSSFTREEFETGVETAREYIRAGEAIQIVLSQRLSRATSASPFSMYRMLRTINPSPYMFYLDLNDFQIIGASPEILVKLVNGTVTTRPLAGTRPRGQNPVEDAQLEEELCNDEKERAEHIMLVDLGRNDIGRVSVPGSVVVSDVMTVERYSHVMHLVTNVEGKLRPDMTPFDALRSCFPAGTVSGAPKIRAMEIIAALEPDKRGPYAGCVGCIGFMGNINTAITIRTIIVNKGVAHVQSGAGIVYDSVPAREYEETLNKARALLKAIDEAEALTTGEGERHVAADR